MDDKPEKGKSAAVKKEWQVQYAANDSELQKAVAKLCAGFVLGSQLTDAMADPDLYCNVARFGPTAECYGRTYYLPAPLPSLKSQSNTKTANLEDAISNTSVLFYGKAGQPWFPTSSTQPAVDEAQPNWHYFAGPLPIRRLATWIESEGKVRAYRRRMAKFAAENEDALIPPGFDAWDEAVAKSEEAEEKAAKEFVSVLRDYADFLELPEEAALDGES
jgi:hypothetical protein